jgi:hypothetical protein
MTAFADPSKKLLLKLNYVDLLIQANARLVHGEKFDFSEL